MNDVRSYWRMVAEHAETLTSKHPSGCLFVMSLQNWEKNTTSGNVAEVNIAQAARLLAAGTHREATEQEVEQYEEAGRANLRAARKAEMSANRTDATSVAAAVAVAMRELDLTKQVLNGPVQPPVKGK